MGSRVERARCRRARDKNYSPEIWQTISPPRLSIWSPRGLPPSQPGCTAPRPPNVGYNRPNQFRSCEKLRQPTGIGTIHLCHANSSACANEAHSTASDAACSNMELWQMLTGRANKQALAKLRRIENGRCFLVHLVVAAPKEMAQR